MYAVCIATSGSQLTDWVDKINATISNSISYEEVFLGRELMEQEVSVLIKGPFELVNTIVNQKLVCFTEFVAHVKNNEALVYDTGERPMTEADVEFILQHLLERLGTNSRRSQYGITAVNKEGEITLEYKK
jgi:hypothetical protein